MSKLINSKKPVNHPGHFEPKTWCECCGADTSHSQKACSLECADWLVADAISRRVAPEELHKYQIRRDRWRTRAGLLRLGRHKPGSKRGAHAEARA